MTEEDEICPYNYDFEGYYRRLDTGEIIEVWVNNHSWFKIRGLLSRKVRKLSVTHIDTQNPLNEMEVLAWVADHPKH